MRPKIAVFFTSSLGWKQMSSITRIADYLNTSQMTALSFSKTVLLQIYWRICQWKNVKIGSTFGKVMDKIIVALFDLQCIYKMYVQF